jgi:hypothetical protein
VHEKTRIIIIIINQPSLVTKTVSRMFVRKHKGQKCFPPLCLPHIEVRDKKGGIFSFTILLRVLLIALFSAKKRKWGE